MKGRTPTRYEKHMHDRMASEIGCIACRKDGIRNMHVSIHHIDGRTKPGAHLGHLHHVDVKENNLMIVEQHRTLAPADAYAARGGWLTGRDAKVITYHKQFGEVGRITISPDMLKGEAA